MNALLLYSGGLDSTTLLFQYKESVRECVFIDYGSKHNKKEYESVLTILGKYLPKMALKVFHVNFSEFGIVSALLSYDSREILKGDYSEETLKSSIVPFRNGIFMSLLASYADSNMYDSVYIATHAGDHVIYPDCRPTFNRKMAEAIKLGTQNSIDMLFPYENKSKKDIADIAYTLNVPIDKTWSCYLGGAI